MQLDDLLADGRRRRGCGSDTGTRPKPGRSSPRSRAARRATRRPDAGPDDDAVILFTSGTSARPKGVVLNYREHLSNIDPTADGFGITADDRVYDFRSFNWASAQLLGALVPVNRGATLVMAEKFSASRFFRHVRDHGVTVAAGNPTTINILLNSRSDGASRQPADAALHHVELGAAHARGVAAVRGALRHPDRAGLRLERDRLDRGASRAKQRRLGTVGRPFAYHDLAIVDADGRRLPPGEIGQVEIGGFADHPLPLSRRRRQRDGQQPRPHPHRRSRRCSTPTAFCASPAARRS